MPATVDVVEPRLRRSPAARAGWACRCLPGRRAPCTWCSRPPCPTRSRRSSPWPRPSSVAPGHQRRAGCRRRARAEAHRSHRRGQGRLSVHRGRAHEPSRSRSRSPTSGSRPPPSRTSRSPATTPRTSTGHRQQLHRVPAQPRFHVLDRCGLQAHRARLPVGHHDRVDRSRSVHLGRVRGRRHSCGRTAGGRAARCAPATMSASAVRASSPNALVNISWADGRGESITVTTNDDGSFLVLLPTRPSERTGDRVVVAQSLDAVAQRRRADHAAAAQRHAAGFRRLTPVRRVRVRRGARSAPPRWCTPCRRTDRW